MFDGIKKFFFSHQRWKLNVYQNALLFKKLNKRVVLYHHQNRWGISFGKIYKISSTDLPVGKLRLKILDFECTAGITVILSVRFLLKNKVFNCVFFSMIFNMYVWFLSYHQKTELSRNFGITLLSYITWKYQQKMLY